MASIMAFIQPGGSRVSPTYTFIHITHITVARDLNHYKQNSVPDDDYYYKKKIN